MVGMPLPREGLPGRTYRITRRRTQRQYLLRPDSTTNNSFICCPSVAAQRSGVVPIFTAAESITPPHRHFRSEQRLPGRQGCPLARGRHHAADRVESFEAEVEADAVPLAPVCWVGRRFY